MDFIDRFPTFPRFKKVSLEDRPAYEAFYSQFDPYSDFSFNNLWVWFGANNNLAISKFEDFLIIQLGDSFHNGNRSYTLLGKGNPKKVIQRVFRWQKAMLLPQQLVMVPKVAVEYLINHDGDIKVEEDEDNRDYVYDIAKMYECEGKDYVKYRHALHYFAGHYSNDIEIRQIDLSARSNRVKLINSLHSWNNSYNQVNQAQLEGAALDKLLRDCDELPVYALGLYIDEKLEAFSLYQLLQEHKPKFAIINHLKCNNDYSYIFDLMISKIVEQLHGQGIAMINLEQDLGLPGLRTHKERLRPTHYLRRYTVTPS